MITWAIFLSGNTVRRLVLLIQRHWFPMSYTTSNCSPACSLHFTHTERPAVPGQTKLPPASGSLYLLLPTLRKLPHVPQVFVEVLPYHSLPAPHGHSSQLALFCIVLISTQLFLFTCLLACLFIYLSTSNVHYIRRVTLSSLLITSSPVIKLWPGSY